jgi:peptide/nickel transport system ATP-binding protein
MALIGRPALLIADEPTTALDVSVQAQILRILHGLVAADRLAILLITHNLGIVAQVCSHVAVMYAGNIVESGPTRAVFRQPSHPYTRALMQAVPSASARRGELQGLAGTVPDLIDPPPGCRFQTRCAFALPACAAARPPEFEIEAGHRAACIRVGELVH